MRKTFILFIIASMICLSGCGQNSLSADPSKAGASDSGDFNGDAEIAESIGPDVYKVDASFKGGVEFEKDGRKTAALLYDPDSDKDQQLSITSADGTVWNLKIPAHALLDGTTIMMTCLRNIKSESLGALEAGVILEPDGLQFYRPATLTASGDSLGKHPVLLGGDHSGSKLGLAMVEKTKHGVSASLLHFSTIYADPLTDDDKMSQVQNLASGNYEEIRQMALDYLKQPIQAPVPPKISLRCPGDHSSEGADELRRFQEAFFHPEQSLINELLAAARTDYLLNGNDNVQDAMDICQRLAKRLLKKADKLYNQYYPDEAYIISISNVAAPAERNYVMFGGEDWGYAQIIPEWQQKIADQFLNDLRKNHDYKAAKTALRMGRMAALRGHGREGFLQDYLAAIRFEVQYDAELVLGGDGGSITYQTSGKDAYPYWINSDPSSPFVNDIVLLTEGKKPGRGKYVGFQSSEPQLSLKMPNSFDFYSMIKDFNPCCDDKPFYICIDRFGAMKETLSAAGYSAPASAGVVQACIMDLLNDRMEVINNQPFYKFEVMLQNENVNAAEAEFTESDNDMTVKIKIRLVHTPK